MLSRLLGQMVTLVAAVNILAASLVSTANATVPSAPVRIVVLGDSLTAGYGLDPGDAFPAQLERLLKAKGHAVEIANAGVSGDTTGRALVRLDWAVPDGTDAVIIALGANDMLSGLPVERARANLESIVSRLRARGIPLLLAGMRASRSLGDAYADAFDAIYPQVAGKYDVLQYPFFLDGVALDPRLNLPDGIHPTSEGIGIIAERIGPLVERLIERARSRSSASGRG
jgi:acyl-CoA thioesterase I